MIQSHFDFESKVDRFFKTYQGIIYNN